MAAHFIHLTDSHLFPDATHDFAAPKLLTRSREILDAVVPQINALNPEFIVHGGDLVCGGDAFEMAPSAYVEAIQESADRFSKLQAPLYVIPGNHDCDPVTGSFDAFYERFSVPEVLTVSDVSPGLRLARVNVYPSNPMENVNGEWTRAHDDALREASAKALKERTAILLVLHTWVLEGRRDADGTPLGVIANADRLRSTIAECPAVAVAVFTGHRHRNRISVVQDWLMVDSGALVGFPMGFRELWLKDDGYFITRFHTLNRPDLVQASYDRSEPEANKISEGEEPDRNAEILLPRLRALWK